MFESDCFVKMLRTESPTSLYKGFTPILIRKVSWCCIFFVTYEKLRSQLGLPPKKWDSVRTTFCGRSVWFRWKKITQSTIVKFEMLRWAFWKRFKSWTEQIFCLKCTLKVRIVTLLWTFPLKTIVTSSKTFCQWRLEKFSELETILARVDLEMEMAQTIWSVSSHLELTSFFWVFL